MGRIKEKTAERLGRVRAGPARLRKNVFAAFHAQLFAPAKEPGPSRSRAAPAGHDERNEPSEQQSARVSRPPFYFPSLQRVPNL